MKAEAAANPVEILSPAPPENHPAQSLPAAFNSVRAIGNVVVLEMKRRKDFYALFFMTALITLLMGSVNFFNEDKIVRYLKELCLFLIWISSLVIAVTTAARQIPGERESRTIFPLLAKPVTRTQVVLGKFWGTWMAAGLCLVCFYAFFGILCGLREQAWPLAGYLQAFVLHWCLLAIVIGMSLLGSVIFAAPSSNNTITLVVAVGILLLGRHLNKVALQLDEPGQTLLYSVYYLIPHLELFDVRDLIIHNWGTIPWLFWWGALLYGAVYTAMFLILTCVALGRKPLN